MARSKKSNKSSEMSLLDMVKARAAQMEEEEKCNDYTQPQIQNEALVLTKEAVSVRENAYVRMGITEDLVESFPKLDGVFDDIGGIPSVIEYLKTSEDEKARMLLSYCSMYKVSVTNKVIPFEAFCVGAGLTYKKLMQIVAGEVCEHSDSISTLLAAAAHPKVVKKTIDLALSNEFGSIDARNTLHKHRGFTPTPKTQQVTIHGNLNQDNRQDHSRSVTIGDIEATRSKISKAVDRFNDSIVQRSRDVTPAIDADEIEVEEVDLDV